MSTGGCTIEEVSSDDGARDVSTRAADDDSPWPDVLARSVPLPPHMTSHVVGIPYRVGGDDEDDGAAAGTLGVVKTVQVCGAQPPSFPPVMSRAYVLMEAALPDGTIVFSSLDEEVEFVIGRAETARGVEMSVVTMSVGERALIHCGPKFGWSIARHRPAACPANTPLAFTVELVRFEKDVKAWELSIDEKIAYANSKRELGNQLHQARRFKSAAIQYNKGLTALVGLTAGNAEGANEHTIILPLRLNLTACYLKVGDWNSALEHSEQVLALQPCNVKALYRRAQAHAGRLEFDEARACLLRAQRALDEAAASGDQTGADERQKMRAEIAAELRKVGVELKRSETQQRRHYAGMFDRMAADDKSTAADRPPASGWASCWWRVRRFFASWTRTGRSVDATGKRN